ncbi:MAG TPA: hypothetical protein VGQ83_41410 [Polyangia bacterium]|jgi:hypothetical protein
MKLVRPLAAVLLLALLATGCRVHDIYRPDLQRLAAGERFVETHGSLDPMPYVVTLRERETITLYDENGNEIRTTTVNNVKPADAEKANLGQVWRYNENRLGWIIGSLLVIGAGVATIYSVK